MSKIVAYQVWIHVEGVDAEGDMIEESCEPRKLGRFDTSDMAENLVDALVDLTEAIQDNEKE